MDSNLKEWATMGIEQDRLLALQTQAAFDEYYLHTGVSKQTLETRFPRPLQAYKEPSRAFLAAIDAVTIEFKLDAWRAWGMFVEGRALGIAAGEQGVIALAARWEVAAETLARAYVALLNHVQSDIFVGEGDDGAYIFRDRLVVRLGHTSFVPLVGMINDAIACAKHRVMENDCTSSPREAPF